MWYNYITEKYFYVIFSLCHNCLYSDLDSFIKMSVACEISSKGFSAVRRKSPAYVSGEMYRAKEFCKIHVSYKY